MTEQEKCDKHDQFFIDLGNRQITPETIVEDLNRYFANPLRHCRVCGGLIPELKFSFSDKDTFMYAFTCYAKHKMAR